MWISRDKKLKKISDAIFQEEKLSEESSRPLEWRRSFNFVNLPLNNIRIINSCTIHDSDFIFEEDRNVNPVNFIKPNVKSKIAITGFLDEEKMRDRIYFAIEENKDDGVYGIDCHKGKTIITLKSGEPTEENKKFPVGLYWGNAFRMNFEPDRDDFCFELSMPEEQINTLIASLRLDQSSIFEVGVYLLSYTFEVDDAFSEPWDRRDIIINETSSMCFASGARVTSMIGTQELSGDEGHNKKESDVESHECQTTDQLSHQELLNLLTSTSSTDVASIMGSQELQEYNKSESNLECHEDRAMEQRTHQELLQAITSYANPLASLVTAIWVLIVVIALNAFFN